METKLDIRLPLLSSSEQNLALSDAVILRKNNLFSAILEGPIEHRRFHADPKCARITALVIATLLSASAKIPYAPMGLLAPKKIGLPSESGPFFVFANSTSFLILELWAIFGTIGDLFGPKRKFEVALLNDNSRGKCVVAAIVTAATFAALISQYPSAVPVLDYVKDYKECAFFVTWVASSLLPIRSVQISIEKAIEMRKQAIGEVGQKVQLLRNEMVFLIQTHKGAFVRMGYQKKLERIASFATLKREGRNDNQKVSAYLLAILEEPLVIPKPNENSLLERVKQIPGAWLTASLQTGLAFYTWAKTKQYVVDDNVAAFFFSGAVVLTGTYLMGDAIVRTTNSFARSICNTVMSRREKTLAEQLRPQLTLFFKFTGLLLNLATIGTTLVVWGDFFRGNEETSNGDYFFQGKESSQRYFEGTISAALVLLLATATLDIADGIIEEIILRNDESDEKEIVLFCREFQLLENLFNKSSLLDFATFLLEDCPEKIKTTLMERFALTSSAIRTHFGLIEIPPPTLFLNVASVN